MAFQGNSVVEWLFLGGAFLTRSGSYNVNAQIYHVLEYFASALRKLIAGEGSANREPVQEAAENLISTPSCDLDREGGSVLETNCRCARGTN